MSRKTYKGGGEVGGGGARERGEERREQRSRKMKRSLKMELKKMKEESPDKAGVACQKIMLIGKKEMSRIYMN